MLSMINEIKTSDSLLCVSEHIDEYHSHYVINNYADDTNELQRCQLYPGAVKFKNGSWEIWTGTDWVFFIPKDEKSYDIVTSPRLIDVVLWAEEKMIKEKDYFQDHMPGNVCFGCGEAIMMA